MASLATMWIDDVPLTVLKGCVSCLMLRRLRMHLVEGALVLTYSRVIGSLASCACSFYYNFISDGFSENIYMTVLVLIGIDEVMHI